MLFLSVIGRRRSCCLFNAIVIPLIAFAHCWRGYCWPYCSVCRRVNHNKAIKNGNGSIRRCARIQAWPSTFVSPICAPSWSALPFSVFSSATHYYWSFGIWHYMLSSKLQKQTCITQCPGAERQTFVPLCFGRGMAAPVSLEQEIRKGKPLDPVTPSQRSNPECIERLAKEFSAVPVTP